MVKKLFRRNRKRSGYTLVQVVISSVIISIFMGLCFGAIAQSRTVYQTDTDRLMEMNNLRLGLFYLNKDLQAAGTEKITLIDGGTGSDTLRFQLPTGIDVGRRNTYDNTWVRYFHSNDQLIRREYTSSDQGLTEEQVLDDKVVANDVNLVKLTQPLLDAGSSDPLTDVFTLSITGSNSGMELSTSVVVRN